MLASGRDGDPRTLIAELLAVLGGGFLFRQLARQLVGLIPVAGIVPKVAIAYGGTWAIGRAVVLWLTEGRAVTSDLVRSLAIEGLVRGRDDRARARGARKESDGQSDEPLGTPAGAAAGPLVASSATAGSAAGVKVALIAPGTGLQPWPGH